MRKGKNIRVGDVVTLISYLAVTIGFVSVVRYIHAAYITFFLILLALSLYLEKRRVFLPRWLMNLLSLFIVLISFFRVDRNSLVNLIVETLLLLAGIKLMEDKKSRDHLQIYIISVFLIAGSALLTLNISFVLYFCIFTFVFTSGVVMLTYQTESEGLLIDLRTLTKILSRTLLIPILAIPLTAFFFIVLPRTNLPFLNFLNREAARSGFTDVVRLGHVSSINEDASVAFRVSMERVRDDLLYWRGIVLDYFDGSSWRPSEEREAQMPPLKGRVIRQTIYLEPYDNRFIFALDKPINVSLRRARLTEGISFKLPDNISSRLRYEAYSIVSPLIPASYIDRTRYLQTNEKGMERLKVLSEQLRKDDDGATAEEIMNYLKRGYSYTLKGLPLSNNPLEEFLFNHRRGNCEYFASSMAVLLRLNGIPARLVGGYRGGHYNDMGGYYIVSQRNAHVWVEAYIDGKGWVRYDPTPMTTGIIGAERNILQRARLMFDAINYYWNAFVITYDLSKQFSLFKKVRKNVISIRAPHVDLVRVKKAGLYLLLPLALIIITFILKRRKRVTLQERFVHRFDWLMKRKGYIRKDSQGLEEFISNIRESSLRKKAGAFVKEIEPYLYWNQSLDREGKKRLEKLIEDIK